MNKARVLIVDDDHEMRVSLAHLLDSAGHDTQVAKSAAEGLALLNTYGPDVILSEGAYSFVEKPFEPRRLLGILKNAIRMKQLMDNTDLLQDRLAELTDLERLLIGTNDQIVAVRDLVFDFAQSKTNVMILGDTGTGKELVARALHDLGARRLAPFVPVNCAAIPPDRFEETVFGTT